MRKRLYFMFSENSLKMYICFDFLSWVSYIKYSHLELFTKIQAIYNFLALLIRSCLRDEYLGFKITLLLEIMEINMDLRDK